MYLKYLDADKMGDKVGRLIRDEMNREPFWDFFR